jgi:hypothetical protein
MVNKSPSGATEMLRNLKQIVSRSQPTLLEDVAGALALVVILLVGLHLLLLT